MTTEMSPRELAEKTIAEEEAAAREERIAALEAEEERRRERAAEEVRREEARAAARVEADRIAVLRGELEDRAQSEMAALQATYHELRALHTQHCDALRAARKPRVRPAHVSKGEWYANNPMPQEPAPFSRVWGEWIGGSFDGDGGKELRDLDWLAAAKSAAGPEDGEVTNANVSASDPAGSPRCIGAKADGSRCSLPPMGDSAFCSGHDPARAEFRSQAAHIAGKARHGLES